MTPAKRIVRHLPTLTIERSYIRHHCDAALEPNRYSNIRAGSGHDLFYKLGPDQFRLWVPDSDPQPLYKEDIERRASGGGVGATLDEPEEAQR